MAEQAQTLRGATLRNNVKAIQNLFGDAVLDKLKARVPADVREALERTSLLDAVPVETFAQMHEALREVLGRTGWDASHAVGMEAARIEFGGVYRVIIRAIQYDTVWDRIERTWNHIVGRGAFRWIVREPGHVRAELHGVRGFNHGMWASSAGRCERLLLMSGAKSATVAIIEVLPMRGTFDAVWVE